MNFYLNILEWLATHPFLSVILLFVQYIIVMKIHHKMHNAVLHVVLGIWFIPQDIVVNVVFCSIIGLELPREWLMTTRMKRWKELRGLSRMHIWRRWFANTTCKALNRFDEDHC